MQSLFDLFPQGLLGRPDWQEAAKMPLAQLPAGSANALAANTGMWDLATALHAVIKVLPRAVLQCLLACAGTTLHHLSARLPMRPARHL